MEIPIFPNIIQNSIFSHFYMLRVKKRKVLYPFALILGVILRYLQSVGKLKVEKIIDSAVTYVYNQRIVIYKIKMHSNTPISRKINRINSKASYSYHNLSPSLSNPSQKENHRNPSQSKILYPLLRHNYANDSFADRSRCECSQIIKMRQNRSMANIGVNEGGLNFNNAYTHRQRNKNKTNDFDAPNQLEQYKLGRNGKNQQLLFTLLEQHEGLSCQLQEKQQQLLNREKELQEVEQKYIRMLEVTRQKSDRQICMLMQDNTRLGTNVSLSKLACRRAKNETVCDDKKVYLREKLENLDISCINAKHNNSGVFSELNA